jgi:hypothetical protein
MRNFQFSAIFLQNPLFLHNHDQLVFFLWKKNRNILFSFPRLTTLCDKVCQWLVTGRWFSPVSSINKTDSDYITEILLKVGLNTINIYTWKIHVLLTYAISELSFNFFGGDFWWILKFSIFIHLCMYVCLWCLAYSLGIQCKRQNIPDHAFYSYSVLNRSLSYICNISFLEVHLERGV